MKTELIKTKNAVLDLLFPKFCAGCQTEGVFLCETCRTGLLARTLAPMCPVCSFRNGTGVVCKPCRKKTAIGRLVAAFSYREKTVREILRGYKYNRMREAGPLCAGFLIAHIRQWRVQFPKTAVVVPVPLHPARMRERGFNQSAEIGKQFAETMRLRYREDILRRISCAKSQVECADFRERRKNVAGVFACRAAPEIRGKTVILIDDIATSCSTMDSAANVLKKAGVKSIWGIVIARG